MIHPAKRQKRTKSYNVERSQDVDNNYIFQINRLQLDQENLDNQLVKIGRKLEIEKFKHEAVLKEVSTLEGQLETQIRFGKLMADENGLLSKQNADLEALVMKQHRTQNANSMERELTLKAQIEDLKKRNIELFKENQKFNGQMAETKKKNAEYKSIIDSYTVNVLSEHNYA